ERLPPSGIRRRAHTRGPRALSAGQGLRAVTPGGRVPSRRGGKVHRGSLPERGRLIRRESATLLALMAPAVAVFAAFFLLPLAQLFLIGGHGRLGWAGYAVVLTEERYLRSFVSTIALAAGVTVFTLSVSGVAGVFLERNRFRGRALLTAMLT